VTEPVLAAVAHVVTTALYCGFQLTVRLVVYPQMTGVPGPAFPPYEAAHTRRVSVVVGPLFLLLALTVAGLWLSDGVPRAGAAAAAALLLGVLAVTWLGAVPEHGRLSTGFDAAAHRRLLRADSARTAVAVAAVGVALAVTATVV
jgi:hypothetical protein